MKVDYCLILAAGFGTRMGIIGEHLPKVVWPVFEKNLLEMQLKYAKRFSPQKIFINLHHQAQVIKDSLDDVSSDKSVEFLFEDEILDIGGAVHNLASRVGYRGTLLVLNADQFLFFDSDSKLNSLLLSNEWDSLLLGKKFKKNDGYNALVFNEAARVQTRVLNKDLLPDKDYVTYTGMAFIRLERIPPREGVSKFFESVANFLDKNILIHVPDSFEYWDFGTYDYYLKSIAQILRLLSAKDKQSSRFIRFCLDEKIIDTKKLDLNKISYNSPSERILNFSKLKVRSESKRMSIVLRTKVDLVLKEDGLFFNEIRESIPFGLFEGN